MRRLETLEEKEARRQRSTRVLSVLLIILMLGSTAGYAISLLGGDKQQGQTSDIQFNGQYWVLPVNGQEVLFSYSPEQVSDIQADISFRINDYQNAPVFIAANSSEVLREIASPLSLYAERVQEACYGSCNNTNLVEKDCSSNLIIWSISENNKVYQQQKCVFIEGDLKAVDAFLYRLLNIQ